MPRRTVESATVVLCAGGYGRRRGLGQPKALDVVAGRSLLSWSARAFSAVGFREFVVFCDRSVFNSRILADTEGCGRTVVLNDCGVPSTFALAKAAAAHITTRRFFFSYGHAPRPPAHIRRLWVSGAEAVATAVGSTSKRRPLPCDRSFLEPPYLLRTADVSRSASPDWAGFFAENRLGIETVLAPGPGEANTALELVRYLRYVDEVIAGHNLRVCVA